MFYGFRLEDHVPGDHLLRRIDGLFDFGFVREALADSYSAAGRPSIEPELMLRMLLAASGTEASIRARQRRKRIERVFGHVQRNLNLRSLKLRGLKGEAEEFTMAAAAYSLQLLASLA